MKTLSKILLVGLGLALTFSNLQAQSKDDYLKIMQDAVGEWYADLSTVKSDMMKPEEMPEMKMTCTLKGQELTRETKYKTPEGEWKIAWTQVEEYDPEKNHFVYTGSDARYGDYRGEVVIDEKGIHHMTEYNPQDEKVGEGTVTPQGDHAAKVEVKTFADPEGKVHEEQQGYFTVVWKKK